MNKSKALNLLVVRPILTGDQPPRFRLDVVLGRKEIASAFGKSLGISRRRYGTLRAEGQAALDLARALELPEAICETILDLLYAKSMKDWKRVNEEYERLGVIWLEALADEGVRFAPSQLV
jgi:hypothetical protein